MLPKKLANSRARIALIDADSVLYAVAVGAEASMIGEDGEKEYFPLKDGEELYSEVVKQLETLVQAVDAEDAIVCLTATKSCYRYDLLPTYKGNRQELRRPAFLRALQYAVMERKPFRTMAVRGLEADDICGISQGSLQAANHRVHRQGHAPDPRPLLLVDQEGAWHRGDQRGGGRSYALPPDAGWRHGGQLHRLPWHRPEEG
jgi:hypothetical protein